MRFTQLTPIYQIPKITNEAENCIKQLEVTALYGRQTWNRSPGKLHTFMNILKCLNIY